MSVDPAWALQKAFFAALNGNTDAGTNVFDRVPTSDLFPRIVIGESVSNGSRIGSRADGCFYDGSESRCYIDVYGGRGSEVGHAETKRIADKVRELLDDAPLDLTAYGHRLEQIDFDTAAYERDADGITRRALMVFRVLTQAL